MKMVFLPAPNGLFPTTVVTKISHYQISSFWRVPTKLPHFASFPLPHYRYLLTGTLHALAYYCEPESSGPFRLVCIML